MRGTVERPCRHRPSCRRRQECRLRCPRCPRCRRRRRVASAAFAGRLWLGWGVKWATYLRRRLAASAASAEPPWGLCRPLAAKRLRPLSMRCRPLSEPPLHELHPLPHPWPKTAPARQRMFPAVLTVSTRTACDWEMLKKSDEPTVRAVRPADVMSTQL